MTTLLQCPNCFAPLPPPGGGGHATCRFCGATSTTSIANIPGSFGAVPAVPAGESSFATDPIGAKALALDFKREHGVDLTTDGQAMERLAKAWKMAVTELRSVKKTEINLPFITATKSGPLHYQREVDDRMMKLLYAVARKLG